MKYTSDPNEREKGENKFKNFSKARKTMMMKTREARGGRRSKAYENNRSNVVML
jgi:hypothetical protein